MIQILRKMIVKENDSLTILPTRETETLDKNSEVEARENSNDIVEEMKGWVLIYIVILILLAMKYYRK